MILFKHRDFIVCVGFDPIRRVESPGWVFWNDPPTGSWETKAGNEAGSMILENLNPQFWRDLRNGFVFYQPGLCFEFTYVGLPYVWEVQILKPQS